MTPVRGTQPQPRAGRPSAEFSGIAPNSAKLLKGAGEPASVHPGKMPAAPADIITSEGQDVKGRSALPPETLRKTPNRPLILNWKAAESDVGSGGRGVPLPRSDGMQDSLAPGGKALSGRIPAAASEHEAENSTLGNENPSSFIKMNSDPINWWSIPDSNR